MSIRSIRSGFAQIELIAAIGSVCVLLSLWLPQLLQWREKARKSQCQTNLRVIGSALQSFHAAQRHLPPGYVPNKFSIQLDGSATWMPDDPSYCWAALILPELGYIELYNSLEISRTPISDARKDPEKIELLGTSLAVYRCPSDLAGPTMATAPVHKTSRFIIPPSKEKPELIAGGSSSYVGSAGYFAVNMPEKLPPGSASDPNPSKGSNNGVFAVASRIRNEDVVDGLANTFAIGERAFFQGSATWVGVSDVKDEAIASACLGRVFCRVNEIPTEFWEIPPPEFEFATPNKEFYVSRYPSSRSGFGSYHSGGAHFLMMDGAVRFITNDIDFHNTIYLSSFNPANPLPEPELLGVFQRLGIRNDGQPIDSF